MFDTIPEDPVDYNPARTPDDGCLQIRESKLNFLLTQMCDPNSSEHLDRLDQVAEDLSQKLNPYDTL